MIYYPQQESLLQLFGWLKFICEVMKKEYKAHFQRRI